MSVKREKIAGAHILPDVVYDNHERDNERLFDYFLFPYATFKQTAFDSKLLEAICARKLKYAYFEHMKNLDVTKEYLDTFKEKILADNTARKYFSNATFNRIEMLVKQTLKAEKQVVACNCLLKKVRKDTPEYEFLLRRIDKMKDIISKIYFDIVFYEKI